MPAEPASRSQSLGESDELVGLDDDPGLGLGEVQGVVDHATATIAMDTLSRRRAHRSRHTLEVDPIAKA